MVVAKAQDTQDTQHPMSILQQDESHHPGKRSLDLDNEVEHSLGEQEPAAKRGKMDELSDANQNPKPRTKQPGAALLKEEYLISAVPGEVGSDQLQDVMDDDAAEGREEPRDGAPKGGKQRRMKKSGQNKGRTFGSSHDAMGLCNSRVFSPEFSPRPCRHGERCNRLHDLRKYLKDGRRPDLEIFGGKCPTFEAYGKCSSGWRCRFVKSHMKEVERGDGRKELVLLGEADREPAQDGDDDNDDNDDVWENPGIVNRVSAQMKRDLSRRKIKLEKSESLLKWMEREIDLFKNYYHSSSEEKAVTQEEFRASFVEPPLRPSEKRKIYFGPETPILAPLTTQGNIPFRRLCIELGAQGTYSEMAISSDILHGKKQEWALLKAHESELGPPRFSPSSIVQDYDNSKDLKFGIQISANAPWVATKATEVMTRLLPHMRLIDLNCGCPIDLIFKTGAGSALLEGGNKLERVIRGMNTVSGEVPITAKLRMGNKTGVDTAKKNIARLAFGGSDMRDRLGAPGCAALTLHGRSRQQRYRRPADWGYIAECATLIKSYHEKKDDLTDTIRAPDENTLPNALDGKLYFLGNGDCYSHVDYLDHMNNAGVDSVMIGRGALVKPWIFEEIEKGQYLDKSASERLGYIEKFVKSGMEVWGSDEMGIGLTRRFLLEYLNFACRYIPVGLLDYLPPSLSDRAPAYRGRNEMETLLASGNYKDWLKISEMFLGPAHPDFRYEPKHKSNSYEMEGEG